ncbi:MAG TPA: mannose-1-phosphate guanylyltransferase/mannose-6-phosphate isomerase, partial [bacterium]|nr:mannose-1-phosphate guanylyltransferase/mannose-6-phosphate isomerase [bacterium]
REAARIAGQGHIVTFGIRPDKPDTGYGYIEKGAKIRDGKNSRDYFRISKFAEKPDLGTAKRYLASGRFFWNSGMFAFTVGTILEEMRKYAPRISGKLDASYEEVLNNFRDMPDISIDYAVMEKSKRSVVLPLDVKWSDVGSWDILYEILPKDKNQNVKIGEIAELDTRNSLILGQNRLIATIGMEDMLIVDTPDALLVSKRGESQKVKNLVGHLRETKKKIAEENITTYRPWGSYTILEEGDRYKIKRIVVAPGEKLSLQLHRKRSEHWVVVKGEAAVTLEKRSIILKENESIFVPLGKKHRLENRKKSSLEIIEVQAGKYLEEDDIVRFDDIYERY